MKVKTFTGSSLPEAIVKAKHEFGNNIILLESKEIPANRTKTGHKIVQVTVSVDQSDNELKTWSPPKLDRNKGLPVKEEPKPKKDDDFNRVIQDILAKKPKELNQEKKILEELEKLKEQISHLNTPQKEAEPVEVFSEPYLQVKKGLLDKGVQESLTENLLKRAYHLSENGPDANSDEVQENVITEMKHLFKSYNFRRTSTKRKNRVVLMVGSTGVGKTTSAMKLAAHQEIYGKKDVAIISTDLYGPSEALKAFSKMNGTAVYEKKRVDELEEYLESMNNDVVIVDTPGQSPFAPNYLAKLEEYVKAVKPTDIFLVLPMNSDIKDLYLSAALYMLLKPSGLVLTKFDETSQPGKVFSIVNELKLPVVAFGDGKRIFIDIEMPKVEYALNKIFDSGKGN